MIDDPTPAAPDLKPCPFCGSSIVGHLTESSVPGEHLGVVICGVCGCRGPSLYDTWEELARRWNERATEVRVRELEAALRDAAEGLSVCANQHGMTPDWLAAALKRARAALEGKARG